MTASGFTDEQLVDAICKALADGNILHGLTLARELAAQAPNRPDLVVTLVHRMAAK